MDSLNTQIQKSSPDFATNQAHHNALADTFRERLEKVAQGGSERPVKPKKNVASCCLVSASKSFWMRAHRF